MFRRFRRVILGAIGCASTLFFLMPATPSAAQQRDVLIQNTSSISFGPARINQIAINSLTFQIYLEGVTPTGCGSYSFFAIAPSFPNYDAVVSSLMSSYLSGKNVYLLAQINSTYNYCEIVYVSVTG